ncbi:hypothetical protein BH11PAT2_BH11PAT2_00310 [soil metagenome]
MNKKNLPIIVLVLVIFILTIYLSSSRQKIEILDSKTTAISTSTDLAKGQDLSSKSTNQKDRISVSLNTKTGTTNVAKEMYKNPTTNSIVSFSDSNLGSRNPIYSILLDGNNIGEVTGYFYSIPAFSPANKYLGFQTTSVCGAECISSSLSLVDFVNKKFIAIKPPTISGAGQSVIESYVWSSDGNGLEITALKALVDDQGYYRTNPMQHWHYDIASGSYSFVKSI